MNSAVRYPTTIDRAKEDIELYDFLEKQNIFKDFQNKDYFILALAYGYANDLRLPIEKRASGGFFRTETLSNDDWIIIKSIAIDEESEEILKKPEKVFIIIEEYAHGGLKSLVNQQLKKISFGSTEKWLEKYVNDLHKDIGEID